MKAARERHAQSDPRDASFALEGAKSDRATRETQNTMQRDEKQLISLEHKTDHQPFVEFGTPRSR